MKKVFSVVLALVFGFSAIGAYAAEVDLQRSELLAGNEVLAVSVEENAGIILLDVDKPLAELSDEWRDENLATDENWPNWEAGTEWNAATDWNIVTDWDFGTNPQTWAAMDVQYELCEPWQTPREWIDDVDLMMDRLIVWFENALQSSTSGRALSGVGNTNRFVATGQTEMVYDSS